MTSSRPSRLLYNTRDGVHSTYISDVDSTLRDFEAFMNLALDWGEPACYAILDTFMSDSMSVHILEQLLRKSSREQPLRLLLADPMSNFAVARGASINQDALLESCRGLGFVFEALELVHPGPKHSDSLIPGGTIPDGAPARIGHVGRLLDAIRHHELADLLEVRFYSDAPSGPLYFFGDVVVCGRFAAGSPSVKMPWSMVIDHPLFKDDHFTALSHEFDYLWLKASETIGAGSTTGGGVFLSYADPDFGLASEVCDLLQAAEVHTFMAKQHIRAADNWREALRLQLVAPSVLVPLLTPNGCKSEWVRNEIAGAWALGKSIVPLIWQSENLEAEVPDLAAARQGVVIAHNADARAAFDAIVKSVGGIRE